MTRPHPRPGIAGRLTSLLAAAGGLVLAATAPAAADSAAGKAIYERCLACHSVTEDRVGPRHCGIRGRRAGAVAGFDYSPALAASGIVWDRATLDAFLKAPMEAVPGTSMTYDGVKDAAERALLVDYLLSLPPCDNSPSSGK